MPNTDFVVNKNSTHHYYTRSKSNMDSENTEENNCGILDSGNTDDSTTSNPGVFSKPSSHSTVDEHTENLIRENYTNSEILNVIGYSPPLSESRPNSIPAITSSHNVNLQLVSNSPLITPVSVVTMSTTTNVTLPPSRMTYVSSNYATSSMPQSSMPYISSASHRSVPHVLLDTCQNYASSPFVAPTLSPTPSVLENLVIQQQQQIQTLINLVSNSHYTHPPAPQPSVQPTFALPPLHDVLPTFAGRDEEDPSEFIQKFHTTIQSFSLPQGMWKTTLRNQLRGNALTWYDRHASRFADYATFGELLKKHFDSQIIQTQRKANFFGQTQTANESSETFVSNKLRISTRLFPHHTEEETMTEILQLLHPTVQVHLMNTPASLDELFQKLEIIDKYRSVMKPKSVPLARPENDNTTKVNLPKCQYCPLFHYHRDCPQYNRIKDERLRYSKPNEPRGQNPLVEKPNLSVPPPNIRPTTKNQHGTIGVLDVKEHTDNNVNNALREQEEDKTLSNNTCPTITISFNNNKYRALLDSGCSTTCANYDILPQDRQLSPTKNQFLYAANNTQLSVMGETELLITVAEVQQSVKFAFVKDLGPQIVLGADWLRVNNASMDFHSDMIFFGKNPRQCLPFVMRNNDQYFLNKPINLESVLHDFPPEYIQPLSNILTQFATVFDSDQLNQTNSETHEIKLLHDKPVYTKQFPLSQYKQEFIKKQIEEMLANDLIERSNSPFNSPIHVVTYPDQSREPRFCIDFKNLNSITLDEPCPGINLHDIVKKLGSSKVFCKIDLKKGYWQIPLSHSSKQYTAFTAPSGIRYQFKVMPFGLKNAPSTFIRLMCQVLSGLWDIADVYLDDIIVKADNYTELIDNLQMVLLRLKQFNLTAHLAKCVFGTTDVMYLGHRITDKHNLASAAHVKAIQDYPSPKTKKQLRSFLGTCGWLREFIPHASIVLAPLHAITCRKPFKWTSEDDVLLQAAKEAFSSPEPLYRPDNNKPFFLQTDASGVGLGASLYQMDEDKRLIIANISASLNKTERSYSSNEKECFAVVWACKKLKPYLEGRKFTLRTDNRALLWLQKCRNDQTKFTRWALSLQELDYVVEHVPGRFNLLPDALSRQPLEEDAKDEIDSIMFPLRIEESDPNAPGIIVNVHTNNSADQSLFTRVKAAQLDNTDCLESMARYDTLLHTSPSDMTTSDTNFLKRFQVINSHLYFQKTPGEGWLLYVPAGMRQEVLLHYHENSLYSHPGTQATMTLVTQFYYWPNIYKDVKQLL